MTRIKDLPTVKSSEARDFWMLAERLSHDKAVVITNYGTPVLVAVDIDFITTIEGVLKEALHDHEAWSKCVDLVNKLSQGKGPTP